MTFSTFWVPELRSVTREGCHQGQHLCHSSNLCHNANNLPLWTWWQHQDPRSFSPFVIKGKGLCSPWVFAEIFCADHAPPDCRQDLQKRCSWRRIQDLPITIRLSTYIHHPTKWGSSIQPSGIHQKFTYDNQKILHLHPRHSGETNIGRYMTLTPYKKEIYDIETNYWKSSTTDSSSNWQWAFRSATNMSFCFPSAFVLSEINNSDGQEPKASKPMPTMHN